MEVVASLSQGRTAAAQCGLFTYKSVPVIFEPPCSSPTETLFPILLLESVVNFSGRDVFSNKEFDHNALFHTPRYLLFAHHSSNSQTGLNRLKPEQEGGWLWLHSLKVAQLLRSAACLHTNQSRSYLNHLVLVLIYCLITPPPFLEDHPER